MSANPLSIRRRRGALSVAGVGFVLTLPFVAGAVGLPPALELPPVPFPAENPFSEAKRVLGKTLFWDVQLSSDNTVACGSCHMPAAGLADPAPAPHPGPDGRFGTPDDGRGSPGIVRQERGAGFVADLIHGYDRQVTTRSAQGVGMAMFAGDLFWDGRASTTFRDPISGEVIIPAGGGLESHVLAPPASDVEMAHVGRTWAEIADRLSRVRPLAVATDLPPDVAAVVQPGVGYPDLFDAAFGDPAVTPSRIAMAIATYERTLVPDRTPFDTDTMTESQRRGWRAFNDPRTRCTECHVPPQFTNHEFRTIGLRPPTEDPGRMANTGDPADAGAFKVPTLRNVGLKKSFMRDGRLSSLSEVLRFYHAPSRLQFPGNLDPVMPRIRVPGPWRADLIAFLGEALTDPRAAAEVFPFDRPTLHTDLPPNPAILAGSTGTAGTGGHVPTIIARSPPNLGNDGFAIGVHGGLGGATARLLLSDRRPETPGRLDPERTLGPFVLSGRGPGTGAATWSWPIPDDPARLESPLFIQWEIDDPAGPQGVVRSPVVEVRFFRDDPRTALPTGSTASAAPAAP
jgi:cytochrome c peroxidase